MDRLKEENELLMEQLRIEKETGWKSVVKWKSKFEESQTQLKKELMLRDQQLKDIAASLLLLEDQLQENIKYHPNFTLISPVFTFISKISYQLGPT